LAQAIIHNPEVLILDEPTTGLDPNQLVEIRNLIKELGKEKTVMFSTHIMQEVEAVCDRIIIINKGNIVADNNAANIRKEFQSKSVLLIEFDQSIDIQQIKKMNGVQTVQQQAGNQYVIAYDSSFDLRVEISKYASNNGLLILQMNVQSSNLENIFKELTSV
jgi:ABC-2 type transport system ATP-binding protein